MLIQGNTVLERKRTHFGEQTTILPQWPGGSKNSMANQLSHKAITFFERRPHPLSHEIGRGEARGNAAASGDAGRGDCATAGAMAGTHQPTCQKKKRGTR